MGTALYQGFDVITKIIKDLKAYLMRNNYNTIMELIGLAHKHEIQEEPEFE